MYLDLLLKKLIISSRLLVINDLKQTPINISIKTLFLIMAQCRILRRYKIQLQTSSHTKKLNVVSVRATKAKYETRTHKMCAENYVSIEFV